MLNVKFLSEETEYSLSLFYGPRWRDLRKDEIGKVIDYFSSVHAVGENNIIMGDFNFVDFDIDKGRGMDGKDRTISSIWETFKSTCAVVDPYRAQYPRRRIYSYVAPAGKSRGAGCTSARTFWAQFPAWDI